MKQQLLLGAGTTRYKQIKLPEDPQEFEEGLITLDINPDRKPDVVWDLNNLPLPFADNVFDEIHIYHVLEHLGTQGDVKSFFGIFEDMWRILKSNGCVYAVVPYWKGDWVWGDPGHTRMIHPNTLGFLSQDFYKNIDGSISSDYRYLYKGNLKIVTGEYTEDPNKGVFGFILRAEK
jgi:SAM-dependent methyltransferase